MFSLRHDKPSSKFAKQLDAQFPGAVSQKRYLDATAIELGNRGFTHRNTLACVSTCRDELTAPLHRTVDVLWGSAFDLSSLAGMLTAGRTGFMAAVEHAPVERGQRRLVLYAMSHVGISNAGVVGEVTRPGVRHASHACGALAAVRDELLSGSQRNSLDPFDLEQSLLTRRLAPMIAAGQTPDLAELSRLAVYAINQDVWEILQRFTTAPEQGEEPLVSSGAVFSGIQIHGAGGRTHVWPHSAMFLGSDGPEPLELSRLRSRQRRLTRD